MSLKQENRRSYKEYVSESMLRTFKNKQGGKNIALLVTVLLLSSALVAYVEINRSRIKRYESELSALRSTLRRSSAQLKERVKREISDSLNSDVRHDIQKRNLPPAYQAPEIKYGVTYVRWGRRDCKRQIGAPGKSAMIHSGLAAGTHYSHTGGGSNYICLDAHIDYSAGKYVDGGQGSSHIYGVEFRDAAWINPLFDLTDTENMALQFHSLPCALCLIEEKINQVMIPGRETCPDGWQKEYSGYVMAGSHGDKHPTEFICVDERPQVVFGTHGDQKGAFLFMVETQCASLLCEPFVAGRELRCVVCAI